MENAEDISFCNSKINLLLQKKEVIEKEITDFGEEVRSVSSQIHAIIENITEKEENNIFKKTIEPLKKALENLTKIRGCEGIYTDNKQYPRRKCRYFNRGFCKFGKTCLFVHPSTICDKLLNGDVCKTRGCQHRHPKNCRHWSKKSEGCRRLDACHLYILSQ